MTTRRHLLALAAASGVAAPALAQARTTPQAAPSAFVSRQGKQLMRNGAPYRYIGSNAWYLAWLGADAAYGDRARLGRELDALKADGVRNIRLAASAELSPLKNSVAPAFRDGSTEYNNDLLIGLDYALAEMGKRDMTAVLYLTNFWEWSGGMMTYLSYVNGGQYINMNDPAHPWPEFPDMVAGFYREPRAVALYHEWIRTVVGRTNSVTGVAYRDDPTIMAWQLANEPRAAGGEQPFIDNLPAFLDWVSASAGLIKSLDANHLVSTGSEGLKGAVEHSEIVLAEHGLGDIDYLTAHIWPGNWSWLSLTDMAGTDAEARRLSQGYIDAHGHMATMLDKPLVIEEFGYPRDGNIYDPSVPVTLRDGFYDLVLGAVAKAPAEGPLAGANFWAWNGEGRTRNADHRFHPGDTSWLGDPPHEPQGWYGVFDSDASTRAIIRRHAASVNAGEAVG